MPSSIPRWSISHTTHPSLSNYHGRGVLVQRGRPLAIDLNLALPHVQSFGPALSDQEDRLILRVTIRNAKDRYCRFQAHENHYLADLWELHLVLSAAALILLLPGHPRCEGWGRRIGYQPKCTRNLDVAITCSRYPWVDILKDGGDYDEKQPPSVLHDLLQRSLQLDSISRLNNLIPPDRQARSEWWRSVIFVSRPRLRRYQPKLLLCWVDRRLSILEWDCQSAQQEVDVPTQADRLW